MNVKVRVLPRALLTDNRKTYNPGDELEMSQDEANRRIKQGKVESVGDLVTEPLLRVGQPLATEKIEAAQVAVSLDALEELRFGEERKTVLAAIEVREQELRK